MAASEYKPMATHTPPRQLALWKAVQQASLQGRPLPGSWGFRAQIRLRSNPTDESLTDADAGQEQQRMIAGISADIFPGQLD